MFYITLNKMKKSLLLLPLLFLWAFTLAADEFPSFPMSIYGDIKVWSTNLAWWTLKILNSSNQELTSYEITQSWKYWSENVGVLPLLLNKFSWSLNFKVLYNWRTYLVDSINDSNKWRGCPGKSSITFVSENCRYDIVLKDASSSSWWSSNEWNNGWSGSWWWSSGWGSSWWSNSWKSSWWWGSSSSSSSKSAQAKNTTEWVMKTNTIWIVVDNKNQSKDKVNVVNKNHNVKWTKVPALVFTFKSPEYSIWNPWDILQNWFTREMDNAYRFAYKNWITTVPNIKDAKMNSPLTRIAMAKMLSNYAVNILWRQPDYSKWTVKFNDVTNKQNLEYDNAVTLAFQLWIMWQNMPKNNFRPNDEVTRAEFATALSRLLYWTQDGADRYYSSHLSKLKQKWIISNDDPKIKEKRWYVMIMLMRTVR